MRTHALVLTLLATLAAGCSTKSPTVPTVSNPFNSADRVPPPALQAAQGVAPPYYQPGAPGAPSTFAPGQTTPSGYPAAPAAPGAFQAAPAYTPSPAPGSATPNYGASRSAPNSTQIASGDSIAIPTDSGSLRFAGRSEVELARQQSALIGRAASPTQLATSGTTRRPATASAWIAGSAPVRAASPTPAPLVRMPGNEFVREPVSLAALDQGVRITPLEPAPTGGLPGEPAPLRVATPPSDTGWH